MPGWNLKLEEFIFALIKLIKLLGFSLMVILDDGFIHVTYMWQWENATSSFLIKKCAFRDSKNHENLYT
jgi:hypothetical protein